MCMSRTKVNLMTSDNQSSTITPYAFFVVCGLAAHFAFDVLRKVIYLKPILVTTSHVYLLHMRSQLQNNARYDFLYLKRQKCCLISIKISHTKMYSSHQANDDDEICKQCCAMFDVVDYETIEKAFSVSTHRHYDNGVRDCKTMCEFSNDDPSSIAKAH
ncbi:CLUMA_CG013765, isoform A [Clunio marinus]|uniref:CLUMA_CG013765, isoform A n=1 Tax=Clunio marinus TaxID=568069 RepID=A0A1J1IJY8_9DIPT|nr:CLUMA_CG013765, isoform A [Clunio marinus]